MKLTVSLLLASAVALFAAQPLIAQPMSSATEQAPMGHMGRHMGHMGGMHGDGSAFMMLLRSANLTPTQRGQLRDILRSEKTQMISVHRQFQQVHEQMAEKLLAPGSVNAADLAPLEQKAFRYQQQIDRSMIDTALAIRNILTSEQLNHLSQVHKQLENLHTQIQSLMGSGEDEGEQSN
ncbi:MAG TPA: periplasmic heavy metal sensor [Rhizomicrobium sp.]|jgi:Spy/CpxP family protein refolding chaperone